jgi:hypothetical protein
LVVVEVAVQEVPDQDQPDQILQFLIMLQLVVVEVALMKLGLEVTEDQAVAVAAMEAVMDQAPQVKEILEVHQVVLVLEDQAEAQELQVEEMAE